MSEIKNVIFELLFLERRYLVYYSEFMPEMLGSHYPDYLPVPVCSHLWDKNIAFAIEEWPLVGVAIYILTQ